MDKHAPAAFEGVLLTKPYADLVFGLVAQCPKRVALAVTKERTKCKTDLKFLALDHEDKSQVQERQLASLEEALRAAAKRESRLVFFKTAFWVGVGAGVAAGAALVMLR